MDFILCLNYSHESPPPHKSKARIEKIEKYRTYRSRINRYRDKQQRRRSGKRACYAIDITISTQASFHDIQVTKMSWVTDGIDL